VDALASSPGRARAFYNGFYLFLVRRLGWLWKFGYGLLDHPAVYPLIRPLRLSWNLWLAGGFIAKIKAQPPDVIIVTHFLPADVLCAGRRAGWLTAPLVVVVTDLYPHRFWTIDGADAVVVSTEETERILRRRRPAPRRVLVGGIPVDPDFGRPLDPAVVRKRLGLDPGRFTVLVTSGGTTVGRFEEMVTALMGLEATLPGRLQLLVVCGEDVAVARRLKQRAAGQAMPVQVFGFIGTMAELMAAGDLIVSKAGGLTVSEALARGLPLILYHIIPGQERLNAEHVQREGAGIIAPGPAQTARAVQELISSPERLAAMRQAVQRIRRPNAADDVVAKAALPLIEANRP